MEQHSAGAYINGAVGASKLPSIAVAAIGLDGAPNPTLFNNPTVYNNATYDGRLKYTISNQSSFVVIAMSCGYNTNCSVSYPNGCTQSQEITDGFGNKR